VAQQFAYMLGYVKIFPQRLPDFYRYLLSYPSAKPLNVDNMFYWSRVKFGLKPTLRVVQMVSCAESPAIVLRTPPPRNSSMPATTLRPLSISVFVSAAAPIPRTPVSI
jgi:hypothetical protein